MPATKDAVMPATTIHAGLGALPHDGGVAFRVWAPNAKAVSVVGAFNNWKPGAHPMATEPGGYWYADAAEAGLGDEYRFLITTADGGTLSRIDPYAKQVTNSVGNAVVADPHFDWGEPNFVSPFWNEMVIYELHVGTFNQSPEAENLSSKLGERHGEVRPPEAAGHQHDPGHADRRVRRRPVVGLQPRAHLRRRELLRRAGGVQAVRQGRPRQRLRGDRGRGVQPLRAQRPRPVALRRVERERLLRRGLLLQRLPRQDTPVGRRPAPTTAASEVRDLPPR